jgi:hypothetical protein
VKPVTPSYHRASKPSLPFGTDRRKRTVRVFPRIKIHKQKLYYHNSNRRLKFVHKCIYHIIISLHKIHHIRCFSTKPFLLTLMIILPIGSHGSIFEQRDLKAFLASLMFLRTCSTLTANKYISFVTVNFRPSLKLLEGTIQYST